MNSVKIIEVKKSILEDNDADAEVLRSDLKERGICYVNVMSSPGSGKTTTLLATLRTLDPAIRAGIMEADIDSDVDAQTVLEAGYPSVQLHTGGMCHLDAEMSRQGLSALHAEELDLVFLENVGNLVCPAEFDTGAHMNVVILSAAEGHDKPLKYPLMFEKCDVVLINKMDAASLFDFHLDEAETYIHMRNPQAQIFPISAKTREGIDVWTAWLTEQMKKER